MRRFFRLFAHYRPRVLTLVVFCAMAAVLALSNAVYQMTDYRLDGKCLHSSYGGWPLTWFRWVSGGRLPGWQINRLRLAGNGAMWLVMLPAPAALAEWLLRRHPPRLRWRLRTMLIVMALVAAFLGWFAGARKRAHEQDEIIAALDFTVRMERWGPRWLDVFGVDRFRRRLVGLDLFTGGAPAGLKTADDKQAEQILKKIARLRTLKYLQMHVGQLAPGMVDALGEMQQLRVLSITASDELISQDRLMNLGMLTNLEHLRLDATRLAGNHLDALAGLTDLKSLSLRYTGAEDRTVLRRLQALPRLEFIEIAAWDGEDDLLPLASLPCLRSLKLDREFNVSDENLARLASSESLEELVIGGDRVSSVGIGSLRAIKHLRAVHIDRRAEAAAGESGNDGWDQALQALREAKPHIVVNNNLHAMPWPGESYLRAPNDEWPDRASADLLWLKASFWTNALPEECKQLAW